MTNNDMPSARTLGLAFVLAVVFSFLLANITVGQHIHAPGTRHILEVTYADTLGNIYSGYSGEMDSVVAKVYMDSSGTAVLWQTVYLDSLGPGTWAKVIDADSSEVQGDYFATIVGYSVQGRTPPSRDEWQVSDHFDIFGGRTVSLTAVDTSTTPDSVVPSATVTVRGLSTSTVVAHGETNSQGVFSWTMPTGADTVRVYAEKLAQVFFASPETINIAATGDVADSLLGYTFDPGDPSDPSRCIAYGRVKEGNGQPVSGATVTCELVLPAGSNAAVVTDTGTLLTYAQFDTTTSSTGYFQFELYKNSDITPTTCQWKVTCEYYDFRNRKRFVSTTFSITGSTSCPVNIGDL